MAQNPALDAHGIPVPFFGEMMVLKRTGIEFHVDGIEQLPQRKWIARGCLYLTSLRMVFVSDSPKPPIVAFDIPLLFVSQEKFNQPIFGANNISGQVLPVQLSEQQSATLPSSPHRLTIYFMEGGVGTFLPLFFNVLAAIRAAAGPPPPPPPPPPSPPIPATSDFSTDASYATMPAVPQPEPIPEVMPQTDNVVRNAYVDPNDPTTVYLQQPSSFSSSGLRRRNYRSPPSQS